MIFYVYTGYLLECGCTKYNNPNSQRGIWLWCQLPYYPQSENYQGHILSGQKFLSARLPQINNADLHRNLLEEVTTLRAPNSTD